MSTCTRILLWILFILLVPAGMLLAWQSRLIYYPAPYAEADRQLLRKHQGEPLQFQTRQGRQTAFYVPPKSADNPPSMIWVCFSGNGSLALHWLHYLPEYDTRFAYLLVDYPSYGDCEGKPSPRSIRESGQAAVGALAAKLSVTTAELAPRLAVLGHSIGCAAALMTADDLGIKRAVLISPFTTLSEVARRHLGWHLAWLNTHRFDNRRHLARICEGGAKVVIFHGTADDVVPVEMGRELAAAHPDSVQFHEKTGQDHNFIVGNAASEIAAAMRQVSGLPPRT